MAQYRKKPVVIEAEQITEAFAWEVLAGNRTLADQLSWSVEDQKIDSFVIYVDTPEGRMKGQMGDWIIVGVKGERYPCKPDIFAATYDPA